MIDLERQQPAWDSPSPTYGVARSGIDGGSRLLVPLDGGRITGDPAAFVPLPDSTSPEIGMMIPLVVEALRVWDSLQLEIGAAAIVTQARPWAALFEVVATWYGAFPIRVGPGGIDGPSGGEGDAVAVLAKTLARYPLVCAVELTGRADVVDVVLEAIPASSRVCFAGPRQDRFTIDYYVNVHRKGLLLGSTHLASVRLFVAEHRDPAIVARASRLLASPARAEACRAAIEAATQPK